MQSPINASRLLTKTIFCFVLCVVPSWQWAHAAPNDRQSELGARAQAQAAGMAAVQIVDVISIQNIEGRVKSNGRNAIRYIRKIACPDTNDPKLKDCTAIYIELE